MVQQACSVSPLSSPRVHVASATQPYVQQAVAVHAGQVLRSPAQGRVDQLTAGIATAVAAAVSSTAPAGADPPEPTPERPQPQSHEAFYDATTGLDGCNLTVPKYSQRMKEKGGSVIEGRSSHASASRTGRGRGSPRGRKLQPRIPVKEFSRPAETCHADLYEDAMARQQRLKDMQSHVKTVEEEEQKIRVSQFETGIRQRRRYYRGNEDTRTHLEREDEIIRRRQEKTARLGEEQRMKDLDELKNCTFRPCLVKKLGVSSQGNSRPLSPGGLRASASNFGSDINYGEPGIGRLQQLVDAQQAAFEKLQALAAEEGPLRERLRALHAELHEQIQKEETNRVVTMLQDADAGSSSQRELIRRVKSLVDAGSDPESAQQEIVEELVVQSQDEVRRRVVEAFGPMRLEAEGELYSRQLSVAHELESLEAKAIALRGGTLCEEAKSLGFDFGLADQVRQTLRAAPNNGTSQMNGGSSLGGISAGVSHASLPGVQASSSSPNLDPAAIRSASRQGFMQGDAEPGLLRTSLQPVQLSPPPENQGDGSPSATSARQGRVGEDLLEASLKSSSQAVPSPCSMAEARDVSPIAASESRIEFANSEQPSQELLGRSLLQEGDSMHPAASPPVVSSSPAGSSVTVAGRAPSPCGVIASPRQQGQVSFGTLAAVTAAAVGAAAKARAVVGQKTVAAQGQWPTPAALQASGPSTDELQPSQPSSVVVPALSAGGALQPGQCQIALPQSGPMLSPRGVASPAVPVPPLQVASLHSPRMPPGAAPGMVQIMQPARVLPSPRYATPTPAGTVASAPAVVMPGYMPAGVAAGYQTVRPI